MRMLTYGLTVSLGLIASDLKAEDMITVDGVDIPLSTLMDNCQSMSGSPEAQIACFTALSTLLEKQRNTAKNDDGSVTEALEALQKAAQYQGSETGLSITGADCNIEIVYYGNYYHISRRNVSTLDMYSAKFDASKLQYDQITQVPGAPAPLSKGMMKDGATAVSNGGFELDSSDLNFEPKSARASLDAYAVEVAAQLPAKDDQSFDFVLVHPQHQQTSGEIWTAFETFVSACQS